MCYRGYMPSSHRHARVFNLELPREIKERLSTEWRWAEPAGRTLRPASSVIPFPPPEDPPLPAMAQLLAA